MSNKQIVIVPNVSYGPAYEQLEQLVSQGEMLNRYGRYIPVGDIVITQIQQAVGYAANENKYGYGVVQMIQGEEWVINILPGIRLIDRGFGVYEAFNPR